MNLLFWREGREGVIEYIYEYMLDLVECKFARNGLTSNGKSSIVEERLYSFFFALFQKNEVSFFSVFPLLHNH
jgi:hypothetical protein